MGFNTRRESNRDTCAIKTSAKAICDRLGERRSPKIIEIVPVVRNVSWTKRVSVDLARIDRCTFETGVTKYRNASDERKGRSILLRPPDFRFFPSEKQTFLREKFERTFFDGIFPPCHSSHSLLASLRKFQQLLRFCLSNSFLFQQQFP